jgi:hypothetical protein
VRDVDPEAGDATVEPEVEDVLELRADRVVPPVEVRLLAMEEVQVVLAASLIALPRRAAAEDAHPVVRRPAAGARVGPDVPVAMGRVAAAARGDEPRVLVARVVGDEVEHDADAALAGGVDQRLEVRERAEVRVHVAVVGDVEPPVGVR